jgi:4-hydroxybenzoate polyprenyltransferase
VDEGGRGMSSGADIARRAPRLRAQNPVRTLAVDVYLGARLSVAGFSALLPIVGIASTGNAPTPRELAGAVAVALLFHVYAYVLNDVVDLDIDRREPQRAAFPLVRGAWSPAAALTVAAAQIPAALLLTVLLGGGADAVALLAVAFVALAAYDVWGKRCVFPPLIELVQAGGWASLLLYGAALVGDANRVTAAIAAATIAYVLLVNGVHGGLRDLANDAACGARTTALLLGARASPSGAHVPPALVVYAVALHGVLFTGAIAALRLAEPRYEARAAAAFVLAAAVIAASLVLAASAARRGADPVRAHTAATWHLFTCMALLAIPILPLLETWAALSLGTVFGLPVLAIPGYRRRTHRRVGR